MVIQLIHLFNSFIHHFISYIPKSGYLILKAGSGEKELTYYSGELSILNKLIAGVIGSFFFAA